MVHFAFITNHSVGLLLQILNKSNTNSYEVSYLPNIKVIFLRNTDIIEEQRDNLYYILRLNK